MILLEHRRQQALYASAGAAAFAAALAVAARLHPIAPTSTTGLGAAPGEFETLMLATALWTLVAGVMRLHRPRPGRIEDLLAVAKTAAITGALALVCGFAAHLEPPPRLTAALAFVLAMAMVTLARELTKRLIGALLKNASFRTPLVIVGFNPMATYVCDRVLDESPQYVFVGFLDADAREGTYRGCPVLGDITALGRVAESNRGLEAAVVMPDASSERIERIVRACEHEHVRWKVMPPIFRSLGLGLTVDMAGVIPLIGPRSSNIEGLNFAFKRIFDIAVASVLLFLGAPLMALAALATLLCDGRPLLFRQTRIGIHGRKFQLLKFRTMRAAGSDAIHRDYVRGWIRPDGASAAASDRSVFKLTADPRITPVGGWLRRLSIDELPQLLNVLRGEMSLIGPRPALPYELELYEDWHRRRLEAPPGITGLWQVSGRNSLSFEQMVQLDIRYIEDWSLGHDLAILLRTVPALIHGDGA